MRIAKILTIAVLCLTSVACSPRDFLTRRLASDLIASSANFKAPQQFFFHLGVISNKEYLSPEYLVLQRRGWVTGANAPCPPQITPPPCWEVALTPVGVETVQSLMPKDAANAQYFPVTTAQRQLIAVTGISRAGNSADVDFTWKWMPDNEVGAALVEGSLVYKSTVAFRHYDDGWRLVEGAPLKSNQGMDDALKDAEPTP
jgi:hypothetical protein